MENTVKNRLIELMKSNNGMLTTKAVTEAGYPRVYLTHLIREGIIERVARGIYADINIFSDDYFAFQSTHPNAIFCHNTSLYFHNMTERTPNKLDVCVKAGTNSKHYGDSIRVFYASEKIHSLGIEKINSPFGCEVKCYNLERTLCDIIKNNRSIDQETRNKSIKEIIRSGQVNYEKLFTYAKALKCSRQINLILDLL